MTEQDIIDIKNSLSAIEESVSNGWWQNVLMIFVGAAPTFLLTYFTQRWTSKKEKEMFRLDEARDERKIKSSLVGKIKSLENELLIAGLHYMLAEIDYNHHFLIRTKNHSTSDSEEQEQTLKKKVETRNTNGAQFKNVTSDFFSNIAQYNYFVKDKKIDEIAAQISLTQTTQKARVEFEEMGLEELNILDMKQYLKSAEEKYKVEFADKLQELVRYIILNKH